MALKLQESEAFRRRLRLKIAREFFLHLFHWLSKAVTTLTNALADAASALFFETSGRNQNRNKCILFRTIYL